MSTILHIFLENVSKLGSSTCLIEKEKSSGTWNDVSWSEALKRVTNIALSLREMGVKKGDSVAILANTRLEWTLIDLAIITIGAVTVPIYHTLDADQISYILNHSSSKVLFIENSTFLQIIGSISDEIKSVEQIVIIEGPVEKVVSAELVLEFHRGAEIRLTSLDLLLRGCFQSGKSACHSREKGCFRSEKNVCHSRESGNLANLSALDPCSPIGVEDKFHGDDRTKLDLESHRGLPIFRQFHNVVEIYRSLIEDIKLDQIATCVYTSGTTGEPKGSLLSHSNLLGEVSGLKKMFHFKHTDIGLLFLPLAHVVARAMQFYQLCQGCITAYAESVEKLPENIMEVKPHFMVVVPRVMEKIYEKIINEVEQGSSIKKYVFKSSVNVGLKAGRRVRRRRALNIITNIKYRFVQKVVFSKLHKKMGGRLKVIISGGAPLSKNIAEFFHAVGFLILEGYGLTETMAAITINRPGDFKFGTVGKPLENVKIRLADDGEILVKGPQVFKGYRQPVSTLDEDVFEDNWFKTGDIGEISRDGFLRITGRKKELIITSAGKNIVPQRVEGVMKTSPYIKDVIVYGDQRRYLSALVIPDLNRIRDLSKVKGLSGVSQSEILSNSNMYQLIKSEIECKNGKLARHETVKKFTIIDNDFTQERGELTPTLKIKRRNIYDHYKEKIEAMYK